MELMLRNNLTLRSGITRDRPAMLSLADARLAADLAAYGGLITHVLPFDRVPRAFEVACHPRPGQAKVIVAG
jgi:threonine dehydrogenase-like Zn-dependent dehydrogenase